MKIRNLYNDVIGNLLKISIGGGVFSCLTYNNIGIHYNNVRINADKFSACLHNFIY